MKQSGPTGQKECSEKLLVRNSALCFQLDDLEHSSHPSFLVYNLRMIIPFSLVCYKD